MKERVLLVLSVIILCIFALGVINVSAATYDYLTYTVTDGKATITHCDDSASDELEIPNFIDGYPVTSISSSAFLGCTGLTSVSIPSSVTSIDYDAFYNCTNLTSITIPDSVTFIGYDAFYNTGYYNNKDNWENDVLYIGNYLIKARNTFSGICEAREGTLIIADSAFEDCTELTSVKLPDSVNSIGNYAFQYCSGLTSITIPDSMTTIGDCAFEKCTDLMDVYISDITNWCNIDFDYMAAANPLSYAKNLYLNGELVEILEIPNGVTEIKAFTFINYDRLTSVILPHSVKKIGDATFNSCDKLESINIPDSVESIGNSSFSGCTSLKSIILSDCITKIPMNAFSKCTNLASIVIPEGVEIIDNRAFEECSNLTNVTIPHTVKSINYKAFNNCSNLSTVSYSGTVTEWNSVVVETENSYLINSHILYNIRTTETVVSDDENTFTVNPINIENGKTVILALYNGDQFVEFQKATYEGDEITFTADQAYTNAKVMVWNDPTNLMPVCEAETVK